MEVSPKFLLFLSSPEFEIPIDLYKEPVSETMFKICSGAWASLAVKLVQDQFKSGGFEKKWFQ